MFKSTLSLTIDILLRPLSLIWEVVYIVRRKFYDYGIFKKNKFQVPIISVGNVTFGGTGKTPFTIWLAKYFEKNNKKAMILMRGYKGKLENSSGIIKSNQKMSPTPDDYGDEALLMARHLEYASIVVGKNRSNNLAYYFDEESPDVIILDDGHQHLKLDRNVNIVLFDLLLPFDRYKVAPRGYLREGLSALGDADIIILGRADQVSSDIKDQFMALIKPYVNLKTLIGEIGYSPAGILNSDGVKQFEISQLASRKIICLAGIASPESFYKLLEKSGAEIVGKNFFPDHHYFKPAEILNISEMAKARDAIIITTEKDIVKIKRIVDNIEIYFLKVEVCFHKGEKEVVDLINSKILG